MFWIFLFHWSYSRTVAWLGHFHLGDVVLRWSSLQDLSFRQFQVVKKLLFFIIIQWSQGKNVYYIQWTSVSYFSLLLTPVNSMLSCTFWFFYFLKLQSDISVISNERSWSRIVSIHMRSFQKESIWICMIQLCSPNCQKLKALLSFWSSQAQVDSVPLNSVCQWRWLEGLSWNRLCDPRPL